ncbi:alpha-L-fucosidase [Thalassotalea fonticola]|uniref:alpha-L-fucosidase n=1 Tax=Thalassotalea fonticola TaxID=3065649 RepID=A0ABZ0GUR4_9GAMM|nr:alpha-L-fucosidase [Colwelliaceae bacterium S1-1]
MILTAALLTISCFQAIASEKPDNSKETNGDTSASSWQRIEANYRLPTWYEDAKFGIFIHWGPYSVPGWAPGKAYSEWYPHNIYRANSKRSSKWRQYHQQTYGSDFGYKDFIPQFKAEHWDPQDWAKLFKQAGARYVIPVGEHHDGFAMWDSALTRWDAKDMGPKRDIIGELAKAVRSSGMKYAVSYHRERHFSYFNQDDERLKRELAANPDAAELYGPFELSKEFIRDYQARWQEICDKYQPDFMWLDDIPAFYQQPDHPNIVAYQQTLLEMVSDYLKQSQHWQKSVYFNNKGKHRNFDTDAGVLSKDNMTIDGIGPKWENPATFGHSFAYNYIEDDNGSYKDSDELVDLLIDVVSKNGNLLLNIGPKADGTITAPQRVGLLAVGRWLQINGEGIYGSRPWQAYGEDNIRYTRKGNNTLFAFDLEARNGSILLPLTAQFKQSDIASIELLGFDQVQWQITSAGLEVSNPQQKSVEATVYKINFHQNIIN